MRQRFFLFYFTTSNSDRIYGAMSLLTHSVTRRSDRSRLASFGATFGGKGWLLALMVLATLGGAGCSVESAFESREAPGTIQQALSTVPGRVQAESYDRALESTPATNSGNACNRGVLPGRCWSRFVSAGLQFSF